MFKKIFQHKWRTILILTLVVLIGYFTYTKIFKKNNEVRYVLAQAEKRTVLVSVSGSGQISALDQIDIKPKISGTIEGIYVKGGDEVKKGKLIFKLDESDYQKVVRDAENALQTAKLDLEKLLKPADELDILKAENALIQAKNAKQKAEDNLEKAYDDGFNTVSNIFLDLPSIMSNLHDMFFENSIESAYENIDWYSNLIVRWRREYDDSLAVYKNDAIAKYNKADSEYDLNFDHYKKTSRDSSKEEIEDLINETYQTTKDIAESIKSFKNYIDFIKDILIEKEVRVPTIINTHQTTLDSYTSKVNSYLTSLFLIKQSIKDYKQAILDAEASIQEKTLSLAKLKAGPDELDIKTKKIIIQQKEDNLKTAQENLAKCFIYAPFDGLISEVKVKKGDTVSPGTVLATLITKQKIVEITLNEIDAAKVKVGQKATLTFDALPDLNLTGKVTEIDTVGTVSQGVTSYGVKIVLDSDDERIKPGMSVNAEIIVDVKPDVLTLPNSAIKSEGNLHYVQLIDAPKEIKDKLKIGRAILLPKEVKIKNQPVEIGVSNDTLTEILSGVSEGDIVISSKVTPQTQTPQTRSMFQFPGMGPQRR
jgi:HlyD family secretion protein